jgi:phosphatidylserine/phosphatidylglycerophosphate/cardiolipin synthase-like enzyme
MHLSRFGTSRGTSSRSGRHGANGQPFSNHAKLVAVDDEAFYIGSQNLYPGRFQELGVIVEIEMPRTN